MSLHYDTRHWKYIPRIYTQVSPYEDGQMQARSYIDMINAYGEQHELEQHVIEKKALLSLAESNSDEPEQAGILRGYVCTLQKGTLVR
jgi:hypothetical protein